MRSGWIAFRNSSLVLILVLAHIACATRAVQKQAPTTLKTFEGNYDDIWNVTLEVIHNEKKIPLKQASKEIGFIASDWVAEERTVFDGRTKSYQKTPSRYRVNVSFRRAPAPDLPPGIEKVTITVSKHTELKATDDWKAIASDLETEDRILASIGHVLEK